MLFSETFNGKHEFSKTIVVAYIAVLLVISLKAGLLGSAKRWLVYEAVTPVVQVWPPQQVM